MEPRLDSKSKYESVMMFTAAVVVVGYAWVLTQALDRDCQIPRNVVAGVHWIEANSVKPWRQVHAGKFLLSHRISSALTNLESSLRILGGFRTSPQLLIDADQTERFAVTKETIVLSERIAKESGQIEKAILKAWLLQRADANLASSSLRLEVLSDVLVAMLTGDQGEIRSPSSWLDFVRPGEDGRVDAHGFRPLLNGMIWGFYENISPPRRFAFVHDWALRLRSPRHVAIDDSARWDLREWRDWLKAEFSQLLGVERLAPELTSIASLARLDGGDQVEVDVVVHREGWNWLILQSKTEKETRLIRLGESDDGVLLSSLLVWQSCSPATLGEVLTLPLRSQRILYVQSCSEMSAKALGSLLREGVEGFARVEPERPFVLLRRSQIDLALKRNQIALHDPLTNYMEKSSARPFSLLGLQTAEWKPDLHAYRVLGAIEAIEWFRSL